MQIEAAVIQIDRSDCRNLIITDKGFCMQKAGLIFKNTHSCLQQRPIIRLCEQKDHLLIRDARRHDPHIYAALCRKTKRCDNLIIGNQIRRKNVDIFFRAVDDVQIYIFTNRLIIKRCITVRLYETIILKRFLQPYIGPIFFIFRLLP